MARDIGATYLRMINQSMEVKSGNVCACKDMALIHSCELGFSCCQFGIIINTIADHLSFLKMTGPIYLLATASVIHTWVAHTKTFKWWDQCFIFYTWESIFFFFSFSSERVMHHALLVKNCTIKSINIGPT